MKQLLPRHVLLAALALLAAVPTRLPAQDPAPPTGLEQAATADRLRRLEPGTLLRAYTLAAGWVQGPLVRVTADALVVGSAGGERGLPLADLRSVWARGRQTRRGAKIGALVGGLGAFGFSAFLGALVTAEGGTADEVGTFVVVSTALGAGGGGLIGGIAGAALPRWRRISGSGAPPPAMSEEESAAAALRTRGRFASLETSLGFARTEQDGGTGGGPSGRVALLGEFDLGSPERATRPFIAVGLEGGLQRLGTTPPRPTVVVLFEQGRSRVDTVLARRRYQVRDVGGVVRAGVERGGIQPYGLVGIGADGRRVTFLDGVARESSQELVGYAAGGGLQLRSARRLSGGVEGRWHSNLLPGQSDGIDEAFGFWTLGATLNLRW